MKLDVLNIPIFQQMLDVFVQTINDERIPEDVRKEYVDKYEAIMIDYAPPDNDFDKEYNEAGDRIKEQRERMLCRDRSLLKA